MSTNATGIAEFEADRARRQKQRRTRKHINASEFVAGWCLPHNIYPPYRSGANQSQVAVSEDVRFDLKMSQSISDARDRMAEEWCWVAVSLLAARGMLVP